MTPERENQIRAAVVFAALNDLGIPYYWGGNRPEDGGLDCSGSVLRWLAAGGMKLPDQTAHNLFSALEPVAAPLIGDLAFYGARDPLTGLPKATHVVLVIGVAGAAIVGANGGGSKKSYETVDAYKERMAKAGACVRIELRGAGYRHDLLGFRRPPFDRVSRVAG